MALLRDRWRFDPRAPSSPRDNGGAPVTRASNGLAQFFSSLDGSEGLRVLDFAGASQANIGFITNLGHRLYSEDVLRVLDDTFGRDGDFYERQAEPERAEHFLQQSIDFEPDSFDGALVWDTLQLLSPGLLQMVVDRLYEIMRPESYLLAFFNANEKADTLPVYSYRISDAKTLLLTPRGEKRPAQFFNNRSIEKLFRNFSSIKFFLTRDNLREVIVRR